MEGNVYLTGQIGNTLNPDGTIQIKGIELVDVVSMIEPLKSYDRINIYLHGPGGSVDIGEKIRDYIASFKNTYTIADEFCASIMTIIHLAVPVERRSIIAGTEYMIHNPLIQNISGNADELMEAASYLKPVQDVLVKTYINKTGVSKEGIKGLMDLETSLTDEQLLTLGFVSLIIPKKLYKAVAFIEKSKSKVNNMSKPKIGLFARIVAQMNGRVIQAIIEDTEKGKIETTFSDIMIGDPITLDGVPAPADTYTLNDGTKLVVSEEGVVGEIITSDGTSVEYTELVAKIDELTLENTELLAKIEALTTENTTVKAETETLRTDVQALKEQAEVVATETAAEIAAKKAVGSGYTPPVAHFTGRKPAAMSDEDKSVKSLQDRRAEIASRKKK